MQNLIFNLSLRFLWNRMDAEDATQEILIKLITNLGKFNGKSKFSTWAYRIATNHLLNLKKSTLEQAFSTFSIFTEDLNSSLDVQGYDHADKEILEKEVKVGCTLAMLQCLDRDLRITFILGAVLKLKSNIGAEITGTSSENFRKRLEKSRKLIGAFLNNQCGVYNPANKCRCAKRINPAIQHGRVNKQNLNFANKIESYNKEMEELNSLIGIYNNHGNFKKRKCKIPDRIGCSGSSGAAPRDDA